MRVTTVGKAVAAPAAAILLLLGGASPASADIHLCSDFQEQAAAQRALDQNPGLAGTLDENGDGVACDEVFGSGDTGGGDTGGGDTDTGDTDTGDTGGGNTGNGENNTPSADTGWGEDLGAEQGLAAAGGLVFLLVAGTVVVRRRVGGSSA